MLIGQVLLLIVVGRLLGEAMQRIGQPAVMGQLIAGILLGPVGARRALAGGAACAVSDRAASRRR